MSSDDNIIQFSKKLRESREAVDCAEEPTCTILPTPTTVEIASFVHVLAYIRQISPDGTGRVEFDDFAARIVLDVNKVGDDDDRPQVNVALAIQGIFPMVWNSIKADQFAEDDEVSLEEIVLTAEDIILQLEPESP